MNKIITTIAILIAGVSSQAQVLTVSLVTQEQNQWCWAGCTKCILNYYGYPIEQCAIAEYARESITWTSFGTTNCCTDASKGCNYWNYIGGSKGSIQDILQHFDTIMNNYPNTALTVAQITSEIKANHLFVERWGWTTGGGHFVVGHGIDSSGGNVNVYYMNPWPGEGLHVGTYDWNLSGINTMGDHVWDWTTVITSLPKKLAVNNISLTSTDIRIYPNPSTGSVSVKAEAGNEIDILNDIGQLVYHTSLPNNSTQLNLGNLPKGIYITRVSSGTETKLGKLVLQ